MAKKSTSASKKEEQEKRLKEGGQYITQRLEKAKQQDQIKAMNRLGRQYGVENAGTDYIAQRLLKAKIADQKLSATRAFKEEQQRKAESERARAAAMARMLDSMKSAPASGNMTAGGMLKKSSFDIISEGLNSALAAKGIKPVLRTQNPVSTEEEDISRIQKKLEKGNSKMQDIPMVYTDSAKRAVDARNAQHVNDESSYIEYLMKQANAGMLSPDREKEVRAASFYDKAPAQENSRLFSQYMSDGIEQGLFDDSGVLSMTSTKKLREMEKDAQDYIAKYEPITQQQPTQDQKEELAGIQEYKNRYKFLSGELPLPQTWEESAPTEEFLEIIRSGKKPDDYDRYSDVYDSWMYDFIYGDNAWNDMMRNGTDSQQDLAFNQIEELWQRFEDGTIGQMGSEDETLNTHELELKNKGYTVRVDQKKRELKKIQDELNRRGTVGEYDSQGGSEFNPDLIEERQDANYSDLLVTGKYDSNDPDFVYWYVNQVAGTERDYGGGMIGEMIGVRAAESEMAKYSFMTYQMVGTYNKLYESGDKAAAKAYLEAIQPYINYMSSSRAKELRYNASKGTYGGWYGAATIIRQPVAGISGTIGAITAILGNEDAADPNSKWYSLQQMNNTTRGARADAWGDWFAENLGEETREAGRWLNGVVYSMADNIMAIAAAKGASKLLNFEMSTNTAMGIIQFVMSNNAASSEMVRKLEDGYEPTEAAIYAMGSGIIEAISERYSVEALLKPNIKEMLGNREALFKFLLKNFVAESTEEGAAKVMGTVFDSVMSAINGHDTELEAEYNALVAAGMKPGDASRAVWDKYRNELLSEMLAGGVSGFFLGGGRWAMNSVSQAQIGSKIRSKSNVVNGQTGADRIIDAARGMKENTQSRKLAEKIYNRKRRASNFELGRLAQNISMESSEDIAGIASSTVEQVVREELTEKGMTPEEIGKVAPLITKAAISESTEGMSKAEVAEISKDKRSVDVLESFLTDEGKTAKNIAVSIAAAPEVNAARTLNNLISGQRSTLVTGSFAADIKAAGDAAAGSMATVEEMTKAKGSSKLSGLDAIYKGQPVEVVGRKDGKYNLLFQDGHTENVDYMSFNVSGEAMATLIEYSRNFPKILDDDAFSTMATEILRNQDVDGQVYVAEAVQAYIESFAGIPLTENSLNNETNAKIQEAARTAAEAAIKARLAEGAGQAKIVPGEGKTTYKGAEYGTDEWFSKMKDLSRHRRLQANALGELVARLGNDVELVEWEGLKKVYGSEDPATGKIRINLAAEDSSGDNRHILTIAAHELTHWIEQHSEKGYEELKKYVIEQLGAAAENVVDLIRNSINDNRVFGNKDLSIDGAIKEIVANACDNILSNETFAKKLQEENPGLYRNTKRFVRNFVARLQQAVRASETGNLSSTFESRALARQGQEVADHLAELWLGARAEALQRAAAPAAPAAAAEPKMSLAQEDVRKYIQSYARNAAGMARTKAIQALMKYNREINWRDVVNEDGTVDTAKLSNGEISKRALKEIEKINKEIIRYSTREKEAMGLDEEDMGARYIQAWHENDKQKMEQLIMDKAAEEGVVLVKSPRYYYGMRNVYIANAIKGENPDPAALAEAAYLMSQMVAPNAVLVPMPPRSGKVTEKTDTMQLAQAISKLTGRPVMTALEGKERGSRKADKSNKKSEQMTAKDMGFRQVMDLPEGTIPYFVDNVVASGVTATAARDAFGYGITLAYAKTAGSRTERGIKFAQPTYLDKDQRVLIPLEYRLDLDNQSMNFSVQQQIDDAYRAAMEDNDEIGMRLALNMAAEENGFSTELAYHGTESFGYTSFDMKHMQGQIFVAYSEDLARTYSDAATRRIGKVDNRDWVTKFIELEKKFFHAARTRFVDMAELEHDRDEAVKKLKSVKYKQSVEAQVDIAKEVGKNNYKYVIDGNKLWGMPINVSPVNSTQLEQFIDRVVDKYRTVKEMMDDFVDYFVEDIDFHSFMIDDYAGWMANTIDNMIRSYGDNGRDNENLIHQAHSLRQILRMIYKMKEGQKVLVTEDPEPTNNFKVYYHEEYAKELASGKTEGNYELYTRPGNQLVVEFNNDNWKKLPWDAVEEATDWEAAEWKDKPAVSVIRTRRLADIVFNHGYTSVRMNNIFDSGGSGTRSMGYGDVAVFSNPDDVKSADLITYDDEGNVIMPSERFKMGKDLRWSVEQGYITLNKAIRNAKDSFSLEQSVEARNDGMIAVHNLSGFELEKQLREGGIPAPSIAIIKAKNGHESYGDVSIVFGAETIDPRRNEWNRVYGFDAYTPTRRDVMEETELIHENLEKTRDKIDKIMSKYGENDVFRTEVQFYFNHMMHRLAANTIEKEAMDAWNNKGMLGAYWTSLGNTVNYVKDKVYDVYQPRKEEEIWYRRYLTMLEKNKEIHDFMWDMDGALFTDQHWIELFGDLSRYEGWDDILTGESANYEYEVANFINRVYHYQLNNRKTDEMYEVDARQTAENISKKIRKEDFIEWYKTMFKDAFGRSGIAKAHVRPWFERSRFDSHEDFDEEHVEATVEGIADVMRGIDDKESSNIVVKGAKVYKSIEDIQSDRKRLRVVDEDEFDEKMAEADATAYMVSVTIADENEDEIDWLESQSFVESMVETLSEVEKKEWRTTIRSVFKDSNMNLTKEIEDMIVALESMIQKVPTYYFEAKPYRAVGINEIRMAIVPKSDRGSLTDLMDDLGVPYMIYDGTEEDRTNKLNSVRDVQFSTAQTILEDRNGDPLLTQLPGGTMAVNFSLATFGEEEQERVKQALMAAGYSEEEVDRYLDQIRNSVIAKIAADRHRLDFDITDPEKSVWKSNDEYGGTIDMSTLCAKRLLYQGTFDAIQHRLPHLALMPEDMVHIANVMRDLGYEVPCGICYVESRRKDIDKLAAEWLANYKGSYVPTIDQLTTSDGLEILRTTHNDVYRAFLKGMADNKQRNPKVVQLRTAYKGEIRTKLTEAAVQKAINNGGLRIQSFSDFEIPHLLDMIQVVMDMAARGLTAQAYTKVPEFAAVFGNTGIKINLSLIGKGDGIDENGNLIFDDIEGIDHNKAFDLRDKYDYNVGTILVGINDKHILAAMADDRIDFIIPFHTSGWTKNEKRLMPVIAKYKDYTKFQNERDGNTGTKIKTNIHPVGKKDDLGNGYWDFSKSGKENAERYLEICAERNLIPKFDNFLVFHNGRYWLRPDGSTDGYWKLLIDTKMYMNGGNGSRGIVKGAPQRVVRPDVNMDEAERVMDKFNLERTQPNGKTVKMEDNNSLPVAVEVVNVIEKEYEDREKELAEAERQARLNRGLATTSYGDMTLGNTESTEESIPQTQKKYMFVEEDELSVAQPELDLHNWMMHMTEGMFNTTQERMLFKQYKETRGTLNTVRFVLSEYKKQLKNLQTKSVINAYDENKISRLETKIEEQRAKEAKLMQKMVDMASEGGYLKMMYDQRTIMEDVVGGKTAGEIEDMVEAMTRQVGRIQEEINTREKEIRRMAGTEAVRQIQTLMNGERLDTMAAWLRKSYNSSMNKQWLMAEMSQLRLRMERGEDVTFDAGVLARHLVAGVNGDRDPVLDALRGVTLRLGPSQVKELTGNDSGIQDLRRQLVGTGIKVVEAKKDETGSYNSLDSVWADLVDMVKELNDEAPAGNALEQAKAIVNLVRSRMEKRRNYGMDLYRNDMDKVTNDVLAAVAAVEMDIPKDPAAMAIIRRMNTLIREMGKQMDLGADELAKTREQLTSLVKSGKLAGQLTERMRDRVQSAIKYNNAITEQSEAITWLQDRNRLITQLKSEQVQALADQRLQFKKKLERDKMIREAKDKNLSIRKRIDTTVNRLWHRLADETDEKNVPEDWKPLAREVVYMFVRNDINYRKVSGIPAGEFPDMVKILMAMMKRDGRFTYEDLENIPNEEKRDLIAEALANLEEGFEIYNEPTTGHDVMVNLQRFHDALDKIENGLTTIVNIINRERNIWAMGKEMQLTDLAMMTRNDMHRAKRELRGKGSRPVNAFTRTVYYGNMTPVYFIKNLNNRGISALWGDFEEAENRNGIELAKAKAFMDKVAEKYHYKDWDHETKHTIILDNGIPVQMTLEQMMALYATWRREKIQGPEISEHLKYAGIFVDDGEDAEGKPRLEAKTHKARKVADDQIPQITRLLTTEQQQYIQTVVNYLSNDMSELGNEASMKMYGIKKYLEEYYFPFKVWDGVKSARSDRGISGMDDNRAAHKGWTKRRLRYARNALVIRDFTSTAVEHIVQMINYNTFAPAIENLNKVLNYKVTEMSPDMEENVRNLRIIFREAYGIEALKYLETWMQDLQGGATQDQRKTMRDRLLSTFKKNAVAGSMSVALQQPLSYIRANMMISPKYMTEALGREYWKGTYEERLKYSGVSVIKDMGKFDMNFGTSAREWILPQKKENRYEKISDAITIGPELMDRWTWNRMWVAVKLEQHDQHPEMDMKSDEFLRIVAQRFNDVMRKTQVYDSTMVKSSNMRSSNLSMKVITSFMAEPTLSLNVLADAVANAKGKAGIEFLAKAAALHLLSAVMQAVMKALMGSGRTPDEKKTWWENFLNRFMSNVISEANPFSLIPGYSDLIEVFKNGELKDDAMGVLGKFKTIITTLSKAFDPNQETNWYRAVEDTAGQVAQLFTNIPAKNIMRDLRAMYNWVIGRPYADRPSSGAVLKYQTIEDAVNADNFLGVVMSYLGDAGYKTSNTGYYSRIYEAKKSGNDQQAEEMSEYLRLTKGLTDDKINSGIKSAARKDDSAAAAETDDWLMDQGLMSGTSEITSQLKEGKISEEEAARLWKKAKPDLTDNDIYWMVDRINYEKETGTDVSSSSYTYRLAAALESNKSQEITKEIRRMMDHGREPKTIKANLTTLLKEKYLQGDSSAKVRIRNAMQIAYQALGLKSGDADKIIDNWKKDE